MKPLSEKTSKTVAKISILIIWILALLIAIPAAVFHKLVIVIDESGSGTKPYCTPEELYPEQWLLTSEGHPYNESSLIDQDGTVFQI